MASREPSDDETVEVYPGFHDELHADIEASGGWVCEEHGLPWPHDDCPGPGMPARDTVATVSRCLTTE